MTEVFIKKLQCVFLLHLFNSYSHVRRTSPLQVYKAYSKFCGILHLTSEYLKKSQISKEQDFTAKPSFHLAQRALNLIKPME